MVVKVHTHTHPGALHIIKHDTHTMTELIILDLSILSFSLPGEATNEEVFKWVYPCFYFAPFPKFVVSSTWFNVRIPMSTSTLGSQPRKPTLPSRLIFLIKWKRNSLLILQYNQYFVFSILWYSRIDDHW